MTAAIGSIGGLTVVGVDWTNVRGVSPSRGLVRVTTGSNFDRFVGDLTLTFGGTTITATECAASDICQENFHGRSGFRWNILFSDRRWKWRWPRISGEYNKRLCDGSLEPTKKKSARELATLLFDSLGETGYSVSNVPSNVFPYVNWDEAVSRLELQWLADLFAMVVCPRSDDTYSIESITETATLPNASPITPEDPYYRSAIMPSSVEVVGPPKKTQGWVELRALGVDRDATITDINSLGLLSSGGLEDQWPHAYPGVAPEDRHLAFDYLYRIYAPSDPNIILDENLLEAGNNTVTGRSHCFKAKVRGRFFIGDDFGTTSTAEAIYTGKFKINKELNAVEFWHPVYKFSGGKIAAADLEVMTGHYTLDANGNLADRYTSSSAVSDSVRATEPRRIVRDDLQWTDVQETFFSGPASNNQSDLDSEAQGHLTNIVSGYGYAESKDVTFNGLLDQSLNGGISQVQWRLGDDRVATTRIGLNSEFDLTTAHHQQRRAQERLSQMAERMRL